MTDPAERVQYLLPTHVARVRDSIFVHLSDPECLDLARGFFKQSIPEDRPVDRFMRLEDWLDSQRATAGPEEFTNTSGIFHLARCGSTLLAQNLKATGQCIVLGEPRFIGQLIHNLAGTMDHELYVRALQAIVGVWQDWAAQQNRHLVIKFSSLAYRNLEDLFDLLPGSRFLFLFREPTAVLESLTRSPPTYITRGGSDGYVSGLPEFAGQAAEGLAYHAAESFCSVLDRFERAANERLACVEYDNLNEQFPAILNISVLMPVLQGCGGAMTLMRSGKGTSPPNMSRSRHSRSKNLLVTTTNWLR